jgi:hypothetical protein
VEFITIVLTEIFSIFLIETHSWWPILMCQKVVWANDMGPQQNQELIEYFKDRKVWLVEPDVIPTKISDYYVARALAKSPM